jgi:NAD-dependent SIR2 family protein deacetylase
MNRWVDDGLNQEHMRHLRDALAGGGRVMVFLGAGLSFGAARFGGRAQFDNERWGPPEKKGDGERPPSPHEVAWDDDGLPLPSWPWLLNRMRIRLALEFAADEERSLNKFFRDEGPLDCAQLFRQTVGPANYRDFLLEQFDARRYPFVQPTPSHKALVAFRMPILFTTNYDELIEDAHRVAGVELRVSANEDEFKSRLREEPPRHLVKLHGSIDRPQTIVLTRDDYSRARKARREMLGHLRQEMARASFLFVGFSLSDPNFNLLRDDIRESLEIETPTSYTVQGRRDRVKERYLSSLDVNTIWLDSWNDLPDFLQRINPTRMATSE